MAKLAIPPVRQPADTNVAPLSAQSIVRSLHRVRTINEWTAWTNRAKTPIKAQSSVLTEDDIKKEKGQPGWSLSFPTETKVDDLSIVSEQNLAKAVSVSKSCDVSIPEAFSTTVRRATNVARSSPLVEGGLEPVDVDQMLPMFEYKVLKCDGRTMPGVTTGADSATPSQDAILLSELFTSETGSIIDATGKRLQSSDQWHGVAKAITGRDANERDLTFFAALIGAVRRVEVANEAQAWGPHTLNDWERFKNSYLDPAVEGPDGKIKPAKSKTSVIKADLPLLEIGAIVPMTPMQTFPSVLEDIRKQKAISPRLSAAIGAVLTQIKALRAKVTRAAKEGEALSVWEVRREYENCWAPLRAEGDETVMDELIIAHLAKRLMSPDATLPSADIQHVVDSNDLARWRGLIAYCVELHHGLTRGSARDGDRDHLIEKEEHSPSAIERVKTNNQRYKQVFRNA